mmetsp:Transcript_57054/g.101900  ORF Transcript_57054/g.101900 Transcript_57054/m.101900 type:complete len:212 (+) Transcript_57054:6950-7585(+)
MDPQADYGEGVMLGWIRQHNPLDDIGHFSQIPLVVKLNCCRKKLLTHCMMELDSGQGEGFTKVLHLTREGAQVTGKDLAINELQVGLLRHVARKHPIVPLQPIQDVECPCLRVHCREVLHVDNLFHGHLLPIVPEPIVEMHPKQCDGILGTVLVWCGHVDVINEEDELLAPRRAILAPSFLIESLLQDGLQALAVGLRIEIYDTVDQVAVG